MKKRLIQCEGCEAVHGPELIVCPNCGRCPRCGQRRIEKAERAENCVECDIAFCSGCGRCHDCANVRFIDFPACSCGHPQNEEEVGIVYESFRFIRNKTSTDRIVENILLFFLMIVIQVAIAIWMN